VDEYETIIKKLHNAGIEIHGFFIFGLDADDADGFKRTLRFAQKARLESAQFDKPRTIISHPSPQYFRGVSNVCICKCGNSF